MVIKNTGNSTVTNLEFDLVLDGDHKFYLAQAVTKDLKLRGDIKIETDGEMLPFDPAFRVSVPFFNPGEQFEVGVFFDGQPVDCKVFCRMEDVKFKVRRNDYLKEILIGGPGGFEVVGVGVKVIANSFLELAGLGRKRP